MCEIQFVYKVGGKLTKENKQQFFSMLELGSTYNGDATGIFSKDFIIKDTGKPSQDMLKTINSIETNFFVGHNRFATQGNKKKNKNNHPFITNDWVMVHNGIVSDYEIKKKHNLEYIGNTDSLVMINLVQKFTKNNPTVALKKAFAEISGSYSCFFLYKKTNELFYLKNNGTSFIFCLNPDEKIIYGSTDIQNIKETVSSKLYGFDRNELLELIPHNLCIYKISDSGISFVDEFEQPKITATKVNLDYYGGYWGYDEEVSGTKEHVKYDQTRMMQYIDIFLNSLSESIGYVPQDIKYDFVQGEVYIKLLNSYDAQLLLQHQEFYFVQQYKEGIIASFDDIEMIFCDYV